MLDELIAIHNEVMATTPQNFKRYLHDEINWENQVICVLGDRGVGKTTMCCQYLKITYPSPEQGLYISADNINVLARGLFNTAREFFSSGGEALCIDEVHKYPNWSIELKNIIDTYKKKKVIFLGSSSIDLKKSKADLSRRVVYYSLRGLSFREFLNLQYQLDVPAYSLATIMTDHVTVASQFTGIPILKYFKEYIRYGYYPFFLEGTAEYLEKVNNVIEKVIYEDIAVIYDLKQTTLPVLKQVLWLIATSDPLKPNIDKISKSLQVSREGVYNCLAYLHQAGLITNLYENVIGMKLVRKPGKIYLNNTSLLHAINGSIKLTANIGTAREVLFVNQVSSLHRLNLHSSADFIIEENYVIEVGGRNKSNSQLKGTTNGYLALDDIDVGYKHKIPLYLFGFLY
ncbi:MAG: AAA family ATPase [Pseudomonadota bacterium]|nr:AAA family ATPase [Pseudomonadota bacterium]